MCCNNVQQVYISIAWCWYNTFARKIQMNFSPYFFATTFKWNEINHTINTLAHIFWRNWKYYEQNFNRHWDKMCHFDLQSHSVLIHPSVRRLGFPMTEKCVFGFENIKWYSIVKRKKYVTHYQVYKYMWWNQGRKESLSNDLSKEKK